MVSNRIVQPDDINVLEHVDNPYLTLITFDRFDAKKNSYLQQVAVRAKLVDNRIRPKILKLRGMAYPVERSYID